MRFDHVALEVGAFDHLVEHLTADCGMRLLRHGVRYSTGQRIAMLGDEAGTKIELIEAEPIEAERAGGEEQGGEEQGAGEQGGEEQGAEEQGGDGALGTVFAHVAFRVDDAEADVARLVDAGWEVRRPLHRLDVARADTALLTDGAGLPVQIISYDADSPDMATGDPAAGER